MKIIKYLSLICLSLTVLLFPLASIPVDAQAAAVQTTTTTVTFTVVPTVSSYYPNVSNSLTVYCPFKVSYTYGDNKCEFPDGFRMASKGPGLVTYSPIDIYYTGNPVNNVSTIIYSTLYNPNANDNIQLAVSFDMYDSSGTGVFGCTVIIIRQPVSTGMRVYDYGFGPDDDNLYTINVGVDDTSLSELSARYDAGYKAGKSDGEVIGYRRGLNDGVESANKNTFTSLLNAVFYAPMHTLYSVLNFDILGVNVFNLVSGIFCVGVLLCIVLFVMRFLK